MRRSGQATEARAMAVSTPGFVSEPGGVLRGTLRVPGDKSITHRALMLGAIADGTTVVREPLLGEDCRATSRAMTSLGVAIETTKDERELRVHGVGLNGLRASTAPLDLGNSGTGIRLLSGLLAGQAFDAELVGDESLSRRPMRRIADPLMRMGARVSTTDGCPPIRIAGLASGQHLRGIDYPLPVASAQVKSAILLAGLYADGETRVREPAPTRDHTERMLAAFGAEVLTGPEKGEVAVRGFPVLSAQEIVVPADISSAAFFMVAASICPGSDLLLEDVGVNPTRTGILDALKLMGAEICIERERVLGGEPVANLRVRHASLAGARIPESLVPLAIDELPVLFVAAAAATGETLVTGAAELRVKESDRLGCMAEGLSRLGVEVELLPDGMRIVGNGRIGGGNVSSFGDHRIAMAFAVAGQIADDVVTIGDVANVSTSFPKFLQTAQEVGWCLRGS
jgi:3-phosphoshikimate 1-carboxyvinyltransferase